MNNHTRKDLDVDALEAALDAVEVNPNDAIDASPLRDLDALVQVRGSVDDQITATIVTAREAGISWSYIATVLGVSRQAARQKYDGLLADFAFADQRPAMRVVEVGERSVTVAMDASQEIWVATKPGGRQIRASQPRRKPKVPK